MQTSASNRPDRNAGSSSAELPRQPRRSVDLDISGGDFMLQGHFSDWESALAVGPDLDRVNVRLAIDATSARDGGAGRSLFSFHSRSVEATGPASYRALGTFTGPGGSYAMEIQIESPLGHTALIILTFNGKRQDFGNGWHDLIANVVPFVDAEEGVPTRPAHAWLVPPPLGAA